MAFGEHGGRVQIRNARQLSQELAIPVYYMLVGKAESVFPNSTMAGPSSYVGIHYFGSEESGIPMTGPVWINWRQWNIVIVPILQDPMFPARLGSLGATEGTGITYNDDGSIIPASPRSLPTVSLGNGVLICNPVLRQSVVNQIEQAIYSRAVSAGY